MRASEFSFESLIHIDQENAGGSLEGYVVNTDQPNARNYLQSQGVDAQTIDNIMQEFNTVGVIKNLYINDDSRGKGFGKDLLDRAIDSAYDNGAEAIILVSDTSESNEFDLTRWYAGYGFEVIGNAGTDPLMLLSEEDSNVIENFADGKIKGKSRPGRFKRAGVSCKGSVASLRKKAKNSSGEKQKGFHWCANMKSGRKRSK